jgi:hypothetical protein
LKKPTQPNWEHGEISAFINVERDEYITAFINVERDEYITTLDKVDPQDQFKIMAKH